MSSKKRGAKPIAEHRRRIALTIAEDDIQLLERICEVTGSRPATMIRELVEQQRPVFLQLIEAIDAAKSGDSKMAAHIIRKSGLSGVAELNRQADLLEGAGDANKSTQKP